MTKNWWPERDARSMRGLTHRAQAMKLRILLALAMLAVWAIASGMLERVVRAAVGCCWFVRKSKCFI
jgi:hypothetical protein